jgi:hypothetical protein
LLKRAISKVGKALALIAFAAVFMLPLRLFIPIFFGSLAVIVLGLIVWSELVDDHGSVSLWPPKQGK